MKLAELRVAALALALMLLAACGTDGADTASEEPSASPQASESEVDESDAEWEAIVEAAKEEGEVTIYLSEAGVEEALKEAFEAEYPEITVVPFRAGSGELTARIEEERKAGVAGADLIWTVELQYYEELAEAGDLKPIVLGPNGKAWEDFEEVSEHVVELYSRTFVMGFNTDLVEPFSDAEELLRPDLKGLIGMQDPVNPPAAGQLQAWLDTHGDDFLERLSKQDTKIYASSPPHAQDLAAGEVAVATVISAGAIQQLKAQGAPVDFRVPDAAAAFTYGLVVPDWATHSNAAYVFLDWAMSEEAQQLLNESLGGVLVSPLPGIPGTVPAEKVVLRVDNEEWTADRVTEFRNEFNRLFLGG